MTTQQTQPEISSDSESMLVNTIWLFTLLLAEITRFKFGREGMSLTNPAIERQARHSFAKMVDISPRSQAKVYLSQLKRVYIENGFEDKFNKTMERFKLNSTDF